MKKAPTKGRLAVILGLWAISVVAHGHPVEMSIQELVTLINESKSQGMSDLVSLILIFMTIFTVFATLTGLFIYQRVSKKLEDHMRGKILENEARSLISLSFAYYKTFSDTKESAPHISNVSISHAAQQAELASHNLSKITVSDDSGKILRLRALALTNAAYYMAEKKCLIAKLGNADYSHISNQAVRLANESTLYVETAERNRSMEDMKWWDVLESRLWALRYCDTRFDKESARNKLEKLFKDESIPSDWKEMIKTDWKDILKNG